MINIYNYIQHQRNNIIICLSSYSSIVIYNYSHTKYCAASIVYLSQSTTSEEGSIVWHYADIYIYLF